LGDELHSAVEAAPSIEEFVSTYGPQLRRFLLARVRNSSDVPDLLQEIYLRMLRVSRLESIQSPEAYLFTVTRHVFQQHALQRAKILESTELMQLLDSPAAGPETDPALQVAAQQTLDVLQRALEDLSPRVRAVFLLHRRDGMSIDDIGEKLGVSRPMVKKYLVRALMKLRKQLEQLD
jgi:RNA polymerase sigma factor (sigma-70 family)